MGPALETLLTFLFLAVLVAAIAAFASRPLWNKLWKNLCAWDDKDKRKFEEQDREQEQRRKAESEVASWSAEPRAEDKEQTEEQKLSPGERSSK